MTEAAPRLTADLTTAIEGRLDIVIVNYETPDLLADCLSSIAEHRAEAVREVIVVDNSELPDGAALVVRGHPGVRLVRSTTNVGYGRAANHGVGSGSGDYVLVLNADVQVHAGAVEALIHELDLHPETAVVGPRLVDREGLTQPSCARFPTVGRLVLHETGLWKVFRPTRFGDAARPFFDPDAPGAVPWVLGAALAIRRSEFEAVGGFDPAFFMYYEEVDLCRRLAARGLLTRFTPAATVGHIGGASTALNPAPMRREMYRSLALYSRRHGRDPWLLRLRLAVIVIASASFGRDVVVGMQRRLHSRQAPSARSWFAIAGDAVRGWPNE